ncbi:hypothetical protein [Paenibacillus validus]|uniref:hypothetical protein n=1 Tax=Paenibacillus validus TaxID=44253 RepID=UPI003D2A29A2
MRERAAFYVWQELPRTFRLLFILGFGILLFAASEAGTIGCIRYKKLLKKRLAIYESIVLIYESCFERLIEPTGTVGL